MNLDGIKLKIEVSITSGGNTKTTEISEYVFKHLIIDEPVGVEGTPIIGIAIPTCELKITTPDISDVFSLMSKESDIKIKITLNTTIIYNFSINNIDNEINKEGICEVTFFGTLFLENFIGQYKQKSYGEAKTSIEVLKLFADQNTGSEIEVVANVLFSEDFKPEDSMKWIQPNVPDYVFISSILKHSWMGDDSSEFILGAITKGVAGKGSLVIIPFKKMLEKAEKDKEQLKGAVLHAIGPTLMKEVKKSVPKGDKPLLVASEMKIETCSGKWKYLLSDFSEQPIVTITDTQNLMSSVETNQSSFSFSKLLGLFSSSSSKNNADLDDSVKGQVFPARIDTGSTHKNYWNAYTTNQKRYLQVMNTLIYVTVNTDESSIRLLDFVYFASGVGGGFSSICIVLRISKYIDGQGQKTQILLAKCQ